MVMEWKRLEHRSNRVQTHSEALHILLGSILHLRLVMLNKEGKCSAPKVRLILGVEKKRFGPKPALARVGDESEAVEAD